MKHFMLSILLGCFSVLISPCLAQDGDEDANATVLINGESSAALSDAIRLATVPTGMVVITVLDDDCCNSPTLDITALLLQDIEKRIKEFACLPTMHELRAPRQWYVPLTIGKVDKGHGNGLCSLYSARSNC